MDEARRHETHEGTRRTPRKFLVESPELQAACLRIAWDQVRDQWPVPTDATDEEVHAFYLGLWQQVDTLLGYGAVYGLEPRTDGKGDCGA